MRARGLVLTLVAVLATRVARADAHPEVEVDIDACVQVSSSDVRKIVTVELGALVREEMTSNQDVTRVRVRCKGALIELTVDDPISGKSLTRTVDVMSAAPKARARLLALAIAELVSASWTELEVNPKPAVPPVTATASAPARDAARAAVKPRIATAPVERTVRTMALVQRGLFFPRTEPLLGFGVTVGDDRFQAQANGIFGWSADMIAAQGTVPVSLGSISVDTVSSSFALMAHHRVSLLTIRGGLGLRFGIARLAGLPTRDESVQANSVRGPFFGPLARIAVGLRPFSIVTIEAGLESGVVIVPVHARVDGERAASVAGPWLSASLALGVTL